MVGMCEPMGLARSAHARDRDGGSKPTTSRGNEQPIELKTKAGILYGIVDLPAGSGPFLVVVSIAGSGPTDRDGNQPGIKNDSLKLREQLAKNLSRDLKEKSDKIIDELVSGRTVPDPPRELAALFRPNVQPFLISKLKYDPAREIAKLKIPVLIVQGTTDVQSSVEDAKVLTAAKKDAKMVLLEHEPHAEESRHAAGAVQGIF
jgi:pimeloyl-ACP methyl ester carboxylesterase